MRTAIALILVAVGCFSTLPATAQQVEIEARKAPVERPARVVPPPLHYETSRPPDADYYPYGGTKVEHDPAFIEPLAGSYETPNGSGKVGLSGWTAPNQPVGSPVGGWRDVSGWFAIGFSVTWGGPPAAAPAKPRPR
jgi:hypothetical protein